MTEEHVFACTCIGELHSRLVHEKGGTIGKVLNAFDTTINIRTSADELLVVSLGRLRSPMNLNVISSNGTLGFRQIVRQDAMASIHTGMIDKPYTIALLIGDVVITISEPDNFSNHFGRPMPDAMNSFASNGKKIFSALKSQAQINRFGCLLNPDITTRGLFATFIEQLVQNLAIKDIHNFRNRISKGLLEMCGRGPGFTPAGDDFIAGYMATYNWLNDSVRLGYTMMPDKEFSLKTTWTSFKLIEYGARNLLDEQAQEMINCIACNDVDAYIQTIALISKRGHTSGIDFATGMTVALFTVADREFKIGSLANLMQVTVP